ncbi:MAG: hypothetical protein KDA42_07140 [Planctomycetales bacterium]|nr:hypothetical protein [Planctomycetales bacterium]
MIATSNNPCSFELDDLNDFDDALTVDVRSHQTRKPPVRSSQARYSTQSRYKRRKSTQTSVRNGANRRAIKRASW